LNLESLYENLIALAVYIFQKKKKKNKKEKESFYTEGVDFKSKRNGINESTVWKPPCLCRKFLDLKMKSIVCQPTTFVFFFLGDIILL